MTDEVGVQVDADEKGPDPRRPNTYWLWLGFGLLAGFGFAVLVLASSTSRDPIPADTPLAPLSSPDTPVDPEGIGDVVLDFPDTLVAVGESDGASLQHVTWPVSGEPVSQAMPAGGFGEVAFDASGRWLAVTTDVPDSVGAVLSMGRSGEVRPVASGVTSIRWHDDEEAVLSYTQWVNGVWVLWVVGPDFIPEVQVRSFDIHGDVAAWGDWGWAVQDVFAGQVTLLTPSGVFKTTFGGVVLDSHPAGWLLVDGPGGLEWRSAGGGLKTLDIRLGSIGDLQRGLISPDGELVAFVGTKALKVVPLSGDGPVLEVSLVGLPVLTWSSDSRFVVLSAAGGVDILDVAGGGRWDADLSNGELVAVSVIALRS